MNKIMIANLWAKIIKKKILYFKNISVKSEKILTYKQNSNAVTMKVRF